MADKTKTTRAVTPMVTIDKRPEIKIIGAAARVKSLGRRLRDFRAPVKEISWQDNVFKELREEIMAIIIVGPLPGISVLRAVKSIKDNLSAELPPLFAVLPDTSMSRNVGALYKEGVSAVFLWPREAKMFPKLLALMIGAEHVRGKAKKGDTALRRSINAHLKITPGLINQRLDISAHNGIVRISGSIASLKQKIKILDILSHIPGVKEVSAGHLHVSHSGISDQGIAANVRSIIQSTSDIDESTLGISVQNGYVTITGILYDRHELNELMINLVHVKGVRDIQNRAVISSDTKENNHRVATRLNGELARLYPKATISVSVFSGTAVLTGRVRELPIKKRSELFVADDGAIDRVVNKIEVT